MVKISIISPSILIDSNKLWTGYLQWSWTIKELIMKMQLTAHRPPLPTPPPSWAGGHSPQLSWAQCQWPCLWSQHSSASATKEAPNGMVDRWTMLWTRPRQKCLRKRLLYLKNHFFHLRTPSWFENFVISHEFGYTSRSMNEPITSNLEYNHLKNTLFYSSCA